MVKVEVDKLLYSLEELLVFIYNQRLYAILHLCNH